MPRQSSHRRHQLLNKDGFNIETNPDTGSVLVFDGEDWVSQSAAGQAIRIYDAAATDYLQLAHDGTDANVTAVNTTALEIADLSIGTDYGIDGRYSESASTDYGATIWALDTAWRGGKRGADSSTAGMYGLKWQRGAHVDSDADVGEGLYLYVNGTRYFASGENGTFVGAGDSIGHFEAVAGNYGSVQVAGAEGTSGSYAGYSVNGEFVLMWNPSGNDGGLYFDTPNEWALYAVEDSYTALYHNGSQLFRTTTQAAGCAEVQLAAGWNRVLSEADLGGAAYAIMVSGVGNASPSLAVSGSNVSGWSVTDGNQTGETVVTHNLGLGSNSVVLLTVDHGADPGSDEVQAYVEDRGTNSFQIQLMDGASPVDGHSVHALVIDVS